MANNMNSLWTLSALPREKEEEKQRVSPLDLFLYQNAMQGNGNAVFGAYLGQRLKQYLKNRDVYKTDTTSATPYDGADTTNQLLTGAMNEQMGATPQELAAQAIYGRPQMTNPADGAATSVEEWIKRNRTSRPQTGFEQYEEKLRRKYNPWG